MKMRTKTDSGRTQGMIMMSEEIDVEWEQEVAAFYQSLGINQGPGDIQYRLILIVLKNNDPGITEFSDIRKYTDQFADRGSIGSKIKTVFQLEGLVKKVKRGGYVVTDKGLVAASFMENTTAFYKKIKKMGEIIERMP